jgi:hypothetical protein
MQLSLRECAFVSAGSGHTFFKTFPAREIHSPDWKAEASFAIMRAAQYVEIIEAGIDGLDGIDAQLQSLIDSKRSKPSRLR